MDTALCTDARMQQRDASLPATLVFTNFASLICRQPAGSAGLARGTWAILLDVLSPVLATARPRNEPSLLFRRRRSGNGCRARALSGDAHRTLMRRRRCQDSAHAALFA